MARGGCLDNIPGNCSPADFPPDGLSPDGPPCWKPTRRRTSRIMFGVVSAEFVRSWPIFASGGPELRPEWPIRDRIWRPAPRNLPQHMLLRLFFTSVCVASQFLSCGPSGGEHSAEHVSTPTSRRGRACRGTFVRLLCGWAAVALVLGGPHLDHAKSLGSGPRTP